MKTLEQKRIDNAAYMRKWKAAKAKREGWLIGSNAGRPANTPEVLWSKVDKRSPAECWPWIGFRNKQGYGRTWINDKGYYAHRVIFDLVNPGKITLSAPKSTDESGFVLHRCDNPCCCNPDHLWLGTHADNMRDKAQKGRTPDFKGAKGPRAKLTELDVKEIKRMRSEGVKIKKLVELFEVSNSTICGVLYDRHYRDVA